MQARMNHPVMILPEAMKALHALNAATEKGGIPARTRELIHLRASQINGCSVCVDMHARMLEKLGESYSRIFTLAAWREASYYTEAERAALDTEAERLRLSRVALRERLTLLEDRDRNDALPSFEIVDGTVLSAEVSGVGADWVALQGARSAALLLPFAAIRL